MTKNTGIELKGYNLERNLEDEIDALHSFVNEYSGSTYVCDAIAEIADSFIPIYSNDIWENAKHIRDSIEEAVSEGLTEGVTDIEKIMQAGYYTYYTAALYNNLDQMAYNFIAQKVNEYLNSVEELQLDVVEIEDAIDNMTDSYDNNNSFDDLEDKAKEIIEAIKDGEYSEQE